MGGFALVHASLRDGGRDLVRALTAGATRAATQRLWRFFADGLRQHHHGEDEVIFALAAGRQPGLHEVLAAVAAEHFEIDCLLDAADRAVTGGDPGAAAAVEELADALERHLDREEAEVLPGVLAVVAPDELAEIEAGFVKELGPRRLALTVAALDATASRHGLLMPPLPLPARALLALRWRRAYAALRREAGL